MENDMTLLDPDIGYEPPISFEFKRRRKIMNELEHNDTCDCCEHEQTKLETFAEKTGPLPSTVMVVEEMPQETQGPVQLSPEDKAVWEKKETTRKLRNARKKAKQLLLNEAESKRERRYIKKVLGGNMSIS
jgi:hypothetical protein